MSHGDIQGRARTCPYAPQAKAVCDRCGDWWLRSSLIKQLEFRGSALEWTGFLVCRDCNDEPQPQLKPIRLPPDPIPVINPRIENFYADAGLQGFTLYDLTPYDNPPMNKAAVLAAVAQASGIPTPPILTDRAGIISGGVQGVVPANPIRSWLLLYNPSFPPWTVSLGTAAFGAIGSINLGPGSALFWSTSQNKGAVYQGPMTGIGNIPSVPYFAWEI